MTRYSKTIIAAVIAVLITAVQTVLSQQEDGAWTTEDTLVTLLAVLGAAGVYLKANTPPAGEPSDPTMSETDGAVTGSKLVDPVHRQPTGDLGNSQVILVLAVVGIVLLVLLLVGVI